jgi:hypothetical protein
MRALVARDLSDSKVTGLSADRRFATAYNAALQAANMAIACAGYRVTAKTGHHKVTIESVKVALRSSGRRYPYINSTRNVGTRRRHSHRHFRRPVLFR